MSQKTSRKLWFCIKCAAVLAMLLLSHVASHADDAAAPNTTPAPINLIIKNHQFTPAEIHVPANQKAIINVDNQDSTPEEFDSDQLGVEKTVVGNGKGVVRLHPLAPGKYNFMGEYHADTAKGVVIAE